MRWGKINHHWLCTRPNVIYISIKFRKKKIHSLTVVMQRVLINQNTNSSSYVSYLFFIYNGKMYRFYFWYYILTFTGPGFLINSTNSFPSTFSPIPDIMIVSAESSITPYFVNWLTSFLKFKSEHILIDWCRLIGCFL